MKESALRVLQSVFGLPAWQVRWDSQVGLDMNFGAPKLKVREPRVIDAKSPRVQAVFARRGVHLRGTHWLCITPGCWRLELADGLVVRDTSTVKRLDCAVARLRGEKLDGFRVDARSGATVLHYDLGARLIIRTPSSDADDFVLWTLSNSSRVVEVYAGGFYRFGYVRQSLEKNYPFVGNDAGFVIKARTAKLERALCKDLRAVAV